jgi:hypothetical protein
MLKDSLALDIVRQEEKEKAGMEGGFLISKGKGLTCCSCCLNKTSCKAKQSQLEVCQSITIT